ncbi:MAG: hypothetical protein H7A23_22070 [Leptospiraceae bacterium]|nr:hypothetical protein [Leptospiraceae bacterium]MCP5497248.1 hypothetical protein [Leptospiraceae bacterium]
MKYLFFSIIFAFTSVNAIDIYVISPMAKFLEEPNMSAKGSQLTKGDVLKHLGEKDMFYKVKFNSKIGWVSKVFVSKKPLANVGYEETEQKDQMTPRTRASKYTEVAAARGLQKTKQLGVQAKNQKDYDFESIRWLESQKVTKKDLNKFFEEK